LGGSSSTGTSFIVVLDVFVVFTDFAIFVEVFFFFEKLPVAIEFSDLIILM